MGTMNQVKVIINLNVKEETLIIWEFLREWREVSQRQATLCGLFRRKGFNETSDQLEDGCYVQRVIKGF